MNHRTTGACALRTYTPWEVTLAACRQQAAHGGTNHSMSLPFMPGRHVHSDPLAL